MVKNSSIQMLWMVHLALPLLILVTPKLAVAQCSDADNDGICDLSGIGVEMHIDDNPYNNSNWNSLPQQPQHYQSSPVQYNYDELMQIGYAATNAKRYELAFEAFQAALYLRPGDAYAERAIANVTGYYVQQQQQSQEEEQRRASQQSQQEAESQQQQQAEGFWQRWRQRQDNWHRCRENLDGYTAYLDTANGGSICGSPY